MRRRGPVAFKPRRTAGPVLLALIGTAQAAPEGFPRFDVEQSCTALVGTADPKAPMRNLCIQREQGGYAASGGLWQTSSPADRAKCAAIAERSKSYKYVYLATCLRSTNRAKSLSTPQRFRY